MGGERSEEEADNQGKVIVNQRPLAQPCGTPTGEGRQGTHGLGKGAWSPPIPTMHMPLHLHPYPTDPTPGLSPLVLILQFHPHLPSLFSQASHPISSLKPWCPPKQ